MVLYTCNFSARAYVIVVAEKNVGNEKIFIISDSKEKRNVKQAKLFFCTVYELEFK